MDMKDSKMVGELRRPAIIKKEHVSERLPSLRGKRDLTLGGVPKRTYSPVIPVRKARPDPPAATPNSITNDGTKQHRKKKEDREKTPKRPRKSRDKDVLTSASVFSMGPAEQLIKFGKNASHGARDGGKVAYNKQRPFQAVKQEPMDTSMSALPDDEGEGLDGSCDFSFSQYPPVQLPLDPTRHVKQPMPVSKSAKPSAAVKPIQNRETSHVPTAADLFSSSGDKAHMLFLQLPDCLPVSGMQQEPMETDQLNNSKSDNPKQTNPSGSCDLSQLPTGYLGKIQVHKSGRVKLLLGTNSLDVSMGTPCDFQQDLVSIHTNSDGDINPHLVTLGQLSHRLICLPDLDQLLTNNNS